jgi:hypothetical protein
MLYKLVVMEMKTDAIIKCYCVLMRMVKIIKTYIKSIVKYGE